MSNLLTPKQRMLNAYRGILTDRPPVAPEFWYYYPAKVLGLDMIEFSHVPFHEALKATFKKFHCEGWGIAGCSVPRPDVDSKSKERWLDSNTLATRTVIKTPHGRLTGGYRISRDEPGWVTERYIKDFAADLPAYEYLTLHADPTQADYDGLARAWHAVGEAFLLEVWLGTTFFDYFGEAREGGLAQAIYDLSEHESDLRRLQEKYDDWMVRLARTICLNTPVESLFIGCSWSCNSLIGPHLWRQWGRPTIAKVVEEIHRHGRLAHVHFHGKCMETVADFAELGIDCVCPFERPPGGDVRGLRDLKTVARRLQGKTTMNGNIHTVATLIRGKPADVRREVHQVLSAFDGNPRLIVGTGDQVGKETPEENLFAMIEAVQNQ